MCNKEYNRYFRVDATIKALYSFDAACAAVLLLLLPLLYSFYKVAIEFSSKCIQIRRHSILLFVVVHIIHAYTYAQTYLFYTNHTHLCTELLAPKISDGNGNKITYICIWIIM